MTSKPIPRYIARLCWNNKQWVEPAGVVHKAETMSYASTHGFGHEEWLCNSAFEWNGWRYGFLEPVSRSRVRLLRDKEKIIDILLYTKDPDKARWYVGEIRNCVILDDHMEDIAKKHFKQIDAAKRMTQQARDLCQKKNPKMKKSEINGIAECYFNIRFRPRDIKLYDPMRRAADGDRIGNIYRYALVSDTGEYVQQWRRRRGQICEKSTGKKSRGMIEPTLIKSEHDRLQNLLFASLRKIRLLKSVVLEQDFVDLRCREGETLHLFEVKADPRPAACIRQAIGQLLEYAYREGLSENKHVVLHVCGPSPLDDNTEKYMNHLRQRLQQPIYYNQIQATFDRQSLSNDS